MLLVILDLMVLMVPCLAQGTNYEAPLHARSPLLCPNIIFDTLLSPQTYHVVRDQPLLHHCLRTRICSDGLYNGWDTVAVIFMGTVCFLTFILVDVQTWFVTTFHFTLEQRSGIVKPANCQSDASRCTFWKEIGNNFKENPCFFFPSALVCYCVLECNMERNKDKRKMDAVCSSVTLVTTFEII